MPIKKALVYRLPSRFIVRPDSTTTSGIGIASEPYIVLAAQTSAAELGKAVSHALNHSFDSSSPPLSWTRLAATRLAAAGVRSEAAFQKLASLVSLTFDGKIVTFTPHRNGGAMGNGKGFSPIGECEVRAEPTTQEFSGATALKAFNLCT